MFVNSFQAFTHTQPHTPYTFTWIYTGLFSYVRELTINPTNKHNIYIWMYWNRTYEYVHVWGLECVSVRLFLRLPASSSSALAQSHKANLTFAKRTLHSLCVRVYCHKTISANVPCVHHHPAPSQTSTNTVTVTTTTFIIIIIIIILTQSFILTTRFKECMTLVHPHLGEHIVGQNKNNNKYKAIRYDMRRTIRHPSSMDS